MNIPRFSRLRRALRRAIPSLDRYHRPRLPFPRSHAARKSSDPFISGDTFRSICAHVFDETDIGFNPQAIRPGDLVFANGSMLKQFFAYAHPHITAAYVLVSHNTDHAIPGAYVGLLEDPKILAWFTQNLDRTHAKLRPIPIGLANAHWKHGDTEILRRLLPVSDVKAAPYQHLAYLNFSRKRQERSRTEVWDLFRDAEFCHVAEGRSYPDYLRDMQASRFVISPPGNGLDCHRHWEALLLGSIPVMKHSSIDPLFDGLPVVLVHDWREVTRKMLLARDQDLRARMLERQRLFAQFWLDRIAQVQAAVRNAGQ